MSSLRTVFFIAKYLERQIVGTISSCRLNWREWGSSNGRRSWLGWREWSIGHGSRLNTLCSGLCGSRIYTVNFPCSNIIKPASVVFVCINIKTNTELFASLNVELGNVIGTKHTEDALSRIFFMRL